MAVEGVLLKATYEECPKCKGAGCDRCKGTGLVPHMHKAETFSKPGTADVTPSDLKHLRPLLEHYRKMAKPFTSCYRDQVKHGLSPEHAKRRCAVLKDLIEGGTDWRGKAKVVPCDPTWTPEAVKEIDAIADKLGFDGLGKRKKKPTGALSRLMKQDC